MGNETDPGAGEKSGSGLGGFSSLELPFKERGAKDCVREQQNATSPEGLQGDRESNQAKKADWLEGAAKKAEEDALRPGAESR